MPDVIVKALENEMKRRIQFGKWLLAVASIALLALPCAAQKREANRPPQQQRQPQPKAPKQERRQQQGNQKGQNNRPKNDRPPNNAAPNRESQNRQPESMGMVGGNRPPNARNDAERSNINPNRPPNAGNSQAKPPRYQDLTPQQKQNWEKFNRMSPQKQQEIRERVKEWQKLTPDQRSHIKNDVYPAWKQLPPARQKAISNRLAVLQNMPESARNQHLNDPNFTRGMSDEDKAMLRDLSHMHVGAPDPPNE